MATWRQYQLGGRVRGLEEGGEERLALDRSAGRAPGRNAGRPVTIRVYPAEQIRGPLLDVVGESAAHELRAQRLAQREAVANVGRSLAGVAPNAHLARPLELVVESDEVIVVRELCFGPSLGDVIAFGPQPEPVAAAILEQLLEGLAVLHAAGQAHLRLSPEAVRFDLLSGAVKVGDLEQAALLPTPRLDLIPRYLEPDVRVGLAGIASDLYSVGRLGEALLRGGPPLGAWGSAPQASPRDRAGPLWTFVLRCQSSVADGRPPDATTALTALRALGLAPAGAASLPLAKFVRSHVGALRELRRWRAQPLPPLTDTSGQRYREVLSASDAARLWGLVGAAGMAAVLFTVYLAGVPAQGVEAAVRFSGDACADDVHASIVAKPADAPKDFVVARMSVPPETAVAIDGCPLAAVTPGEVLLAVEPGLHDLRAAIGEKVAAVSLVAKMGAQSVVNLTSAAVSRGDPIAALAQLAKDRAQPAEESADDFDPIAVGMFDPAARHLVAVDSRKVEHNLELLTALPDSIALALDGLRAGVRRFKVAEAPCAAKLTEAVNTELGPASPSVDDADLRLAVAVLTVTRIRGPELRVPLRIENEALSELGVTPGRRMLGAVTTLSQSPELTSCLDGLAAAVHQIDTFSALALSQIPGASDETETDDRESSE